MIAYLILVHRYPGQFKRMFEAIYDPLNHYLVHIDRKPAHPPPTSPASSAPKERGRPWRPQRRYRR